MKPDLLNWGRHLDRQDREIVLRLRGPQPLAKLIQDVADALLERFGSAPADRFLEPGVAEQNACAVRRLGNTIGVEVGAGRQDAACTDRST